MRGMPGYKIKFTYQDYRNLPESETKRYELLGGELVMVPSPTTYHQRISRNLEHILIDFVRQYDLGEIFNAPIDVILSQEDVVQPDILFIAEERSSIITEEAICGAPDLIIEVLSAVTAERDQTYKRTLYARYGIKEYWLVDPKQRTIEVLTLGERGFRSVAVYTRTVSSPLLPQLSIDLTEVF